MESETCPVLFNRQPRFHFDFNVMLCVLFNTLFNQNVQSCYLSLVLWTYFNDFSVIVQFRGSQYFIVHLNIYSIDYPEKVKPRIYVLYFFFLHFSVISSKYQIIVGVLLLYSGKCKIRLYIIIYTYAFT